MREMAELYGWAGKILWVDLTRGKITKKPTTDYQPEKFIGGVGLNAKIFWDLGCPKVSAFDPNNPLLISVGPLAGLYGPGFNRAEVCGIGPQCYPKELFTYSGIGGRWPAQLKYAGYDGMVIIGRADKPVYLSIHDDDVEIKDASDLWGLDTFETQEVLKDEYPNASILTIGPAGENLSRIASILTETGDAAGQGGFGGVMGSKNLKAIVVEGTGNVNVADPEKLWRLYEFIKERVNPNVWIAKLFKIPYFSKGKAIDESKKYFIKQIGCYGCPNQCLAMYYVPGLGRGSAQCMEWCYASFSDSFKPTWESVLIHQKLGINNFDFYGIMMIVNECHKEGILRAEEDFGLPCPEWMGGTASDHEFLTALANKIASGKTIFSEGGARVAEYFGRKDERVLHIYRKIYGARGYVHHWMNTIAGVIAWATDTRDPFDSIHDVKFINKDIAEHFGFPVTTADMLISPERKPEEVVYDGAEVVAIWCEHNQCLKNSLTICEFWCFPNTFFEPPAMDIRKFECEVFHAVTGIDVTANELDKIGERIFNLLRAIAIKRENRSRKDDTVHEEPFGAKFKGPGYRLGIYGPLNKAKFESIMDNYYRLRGWDVKTGRPTREKLEELDLKDVADELERRGLLP